MFQWISILGFAGITAVLLLYSVLFPKGGSAGLTVLRQSQKPSWRIKIEKFVFLLGLFSFLVLLVTGFGPLLLGARLHGYLLMCHAIFAPVFIACAAYVAVTGTGQYCFNKKDAESILRMTQCDRKQGCWLTDSGVGAKAGFWLLLLLTLPLTLSMALSMLSLFGTQSLGLLLDVHRWCAFVFVLTAIVELYILIRMHTLKDMHGGVE